MRHITEIYKEWQPTYAAYERWDEDRYKNERRAQAVNEMVSEAGEVLSVVTKASRKEDHIPRARIVDELGDTLWGLVGVMNEFDISWEELIDFNMEKLTLRNMEKDMEKFKSVEWVEDANND